MAGGISFTATAPGLALVEKKLATAAKRVPQSTVDTMQRVIIYAEADVRKNSFSGTKGYDPFWGVTGAAGDQLGARTGNARRSIRSQVLKRFRTVIGSVGSPLKYVALHERGGTVHGKPWLRIPTAAAQRAISGTDPLGGKSARSLPNTTIIRSKAGKLWIAEVGTGRSKRAAEINGVPLLLFLLVPSVTFRPRRMFASALRRVLPFARREFSTRLKEIVR